MIDIHARTVGLVSMPWMAVGLPSIQLATLSAALRDEHIESRSYELFLDYAARIGPNLYSILSDAGGFIEEWLFARQYYGAEIGDDLETFRAHRPRFGLESVELEDRTLDALVSETEQFLAEVAERREWSEHDIVGFSLTISQTAASMALARLLKHRFPDIKIIMGGSSCAGSMGRALVTICPYVDVVVSIEGELVLPELVRRLRTGKSLDDMPGVFHRDAKEVIRGKRETPLHGRGGVGSLLNFDAYFERLEALDLRRRIQVWLPFESSRGCWWGEKHQCTFCGLHEIMKFRGFPWERVLQQLEYLAQRYGIGRFFAVDLIMPRDYMRTLLPEIARRGHEWSLFYEIKANLKRSDVEMLAASGVRWIQPGIESLDDGILKLMSKGVTALQNIQLLKWCRELDIRVTWNLITGMPGEDPDAYQTMAALIPRLYHLMPPSGASPFQLHRFSPYFEKAADYGITWLGAHPLYRHIFPVAQRHLDELVYLHDYSMEGGQSPATYTAPVVDAIAEWHAARRRKASLDCRRMADGGYKIVDSRVLPERCILLGRSEAVLYDLLDSAAAESDLDAVFGTACPDEADDLRRDGGIKTRIEAWQAQGLVWRHRGRALALAVRQAQRAGGDARQSLELNAPVAYLGDPYSRRQEVANEKLS